MNSPMMMLKGISNFFMIPLLSQMNCLPLIFYHLSMFMKAADADIKKAGLTGFFNNHL
ncbi:hypothetical protein GCM10022378_12560 [Salinicoccus jeotgali]|uniref:Uncharacterized protein n=1 Tax=Salinicoccus jeotgali TaxID=381634 RepID=A0ABP7EVR0_9STAP